MEVRPFAAIWFPVCLLRSLVVMLSLTGIGVAQAVPPTPPVGLTPTWALSEGVGADQGVELEGELEIMYQDFEDGQQRLLYSLKLPDGTRVPLQFVNEPPTHLLTGDHVRVSGQQSDGGLLLYSGSTNVSKTGSGSTTTSSIPVPYTFGAQHTIVILVNFQDNTSQPFTVADMQNFAFGTGNTLNSYVLENSYGQTWFTGDVTGWYTMPMTVANCNLDAVATYAQNFATSNGYNLANYNRQVYAFPQVTSCSGEGFGGTSTVGGNPSQTWLNGPSTAQLFYHEMGHALGLWHSHLLDCGTSATICSNATVVEYGDLIDTMGTPQGPSPDFNTFQKERLGWLGYGTSPAIQSVTTSGTYTITAYEHGSGPNALKILKSTDPTTGAKTWYYLEARKAVGFDAFLTNGTCATCWTENETTGVLFHLGTDGDSNSSDLLDMTPATSEAWWNYDPSLVVGQSFQDSTAGVTFTTGSVTSAGAVMSVQFSGGGSNSTTQCTGVPSLTVATNQTNYNPGQTVSITATATCSGSPVAKASVNFAMTSPNGGQATGSATTGNNGVATYKLKLKQTAPAGTYIASAAAIIQANALSAQMRFTVQ